MHLLLFFLFMFPYLIYSQILTPETIIKKRDSLLTLNNDLKYINNINKFKLDSLNKVYYNEKKKRIVEPKKLEILQYQIKEKEIQILLNNKQIQNNIRLIRRFPLPTSSTGKSKIN